MVSGLTRSTASYRTQSTSSVEVALASCFSSPVSWVISPGSSAYVIVITQACACPRRAASATGRYVPKPMVLGPGQDLHRWRCLWSWHRRIPLGNVPAMPDRVLYTAEATSMGDGRNGYIVSTNLDLDLAMPPELGGDGTRIGTNPEQLFAAGYAACFHSALRLVTSRAGLEPGESTIAAQVGIGPEGDAFGLVVTIVIHIPGLDRDRARELAEAAHQVCPYSRATRGNISVELRVL